MFGKKITAAAIVCLALVSSGCISFKYIGNDLIAGVNESEVIVNIGSTVYSGNYHIFIDGVYKDSMKKRGGIAKYIVGNGQRVVSVQWQGTYGTPSDRASVNFEANSNRIVVNAIKPSNADRMEMQLEGVSDLAR